MKRLATHVVDGMINHDDVAVSWAAIDAALGRKADRRKRYTLIDGEACEVAEWTATCTGCDGGGCDECRGKGKVRRSHWFPAI